MNKTIATLTLATALVAAPLVATPASAHTGDMNVTAVCNEVTGQYDFTAKLTISQTGLTGSTRWEVGTSAFEGTPTNANGMNSDPIVSTGATTLTLTTFSLPGATTGYGPWVYAFTQWSDNYMKGSDGQLRTKLAGDCVILIPEKPEPRPFADETVDANCETVTTHAREGYYELTLVNNVWREDVEPTITAEASSVRDTTPEERAANPACEAIVPPPTTPPVPPVDEPPTLASAGPADAFVLGVIGVLFLLAGLVVLGLVLYSRFYGRIHGPIRKSLEDTK